MECRCGADWPKAQTRHAQDEQREESQAGRLLHSMIIMRPHQSESLTRLMGFIAPAITTHRFRFIAGGDAFMLKT